MALIAIASDKGAPGVTTAALALAAVWPRPVLLAECDPAGGDLVYRFPAAGGGYLDPRRGVLSLAVAARRGMQPQQFWEHTQKLHGGLDVLAGVTNAEQGAGLSLLWGPIGKVLASLSQADVIADCGRLGADGPLYDLLAEATTVVLVTRVHVADVIRLRDRAIAFAAAAQSRGRRGFGVGVVAVADHKKFQASLGEVQHVLSQASAPATVLGGIAHDTKGADLLSGEWGGNLDRTALIKTARSVARQLTEGLPPVGSASRSPATATGTGPQPAVPPSFLSPVGAPSAASRPEAPPSFRPASVASSPAAPAALSAVSRSPAASSPGTASASAPRIAFSRVLGARTGRHHSDQGPGGRPTSAGPIPASPAPATPSLGTHNPTTPDSSTPIPSTPATATPAAFSDPWSGVWPAHDPARPAGSGYTWTPMSPLTASGADAASGAGIPSGASSADTSRPPPGSGPETRITEIPQDPEISETPGTSGTPATPAVADRSDISSRRDQRRPDESGWDLPSRPPTGPMGSSRSGGG